MNRCRAFRRTDSLMVFWVKREKLEFVGKDLHYVSLTYLTYKDSFVIRSPSIERRLYYTVPHASILTDRSSLVGESMNNGNAISAHRFCEMSSHKESIKGHLTNLSVSEVPSPNGKHIRS